MGTRARRGAARRRVVLPLRADLAGRLVRRYKRFFADIETEDGRLVQRADCDGVSPADAIDPAYGEALRRAVRDGVEVRAVRARISPRGIRLDGSLPVHL